MSIKQKKKHCYLGHPCRGCPYVFTQGGTDCIMGAVPGECVWYFYLSLLGYHYTQQEKMEIQKRYEQHTCQTADYLGRFPQIISDGNTCHSLRSMRQKHIISGVTADYRGLISVQLWLD